VPQVLNLGTGSITIQFHVVFDEQFSTVASIEKETYPPVHWEELCLKSSVRITTDNPPYHLDDDWLTEEEQEVKRHNLQRETTIRDATLLRIDPKPHDTRAAPMDREQAPQPVPTNGAAPAEREKAPHPVPMNVTRPTPYAIVDNENTTPRVSNISTIQVKI
jgi:hypothetical protein